MDATDIRTQREENAKADRAEAKIEEQRLQERSK
jgi:hypothetical protein